MKTTKQTRTQIKVDKLVGKNKNGDYYWLDYVFDNGKDFQGAVGSVFCPVSEARKEDVMSFDNAKDRFRDLWADAAKDGHTEQSLDDYVQMIIDGDGEEAFFDLSDYDNGIKIAEIYNSELPADADESDKAEFSECVGGGRCFSHKIKWAKVYDQKALDLALAHEKDQTN